MLWGDHCELFFSSKKHIVDKQIFVETNACCYNMCKALLCDFQRHTAFWIFQYPRGRSCYTRCGNWYSNHRYNNVLKGFPCGSVVKNLPPMQETWVWSLIPEDPICQRATEPVCTTTIEPVPYSLGTTTTEPTHHRAHALQWRVPPLLASREKPTQQWRPSMAKKIQ